MLRAGALSHNLATMAGWCRDRGVELAPHGKTHMAPQLLAPPVRVGSVRRHRRDHQPGAYLPGIRCARFHSRQRAGGCRRPALGRRGVRRRSRISADVLGGLGGWREQMASALRGAARPVDVCVEIGLPGGRTGVREAVRRGRGGTCRSGRVPPCGWSALRAMRPRSVTTSRPTGSRAYRLPVAAAVGRRTVGRRCSRPTASWRPRAAAPTSTLSPMC